MIISFSRKEKRHETSILSYGEQKLHSPDQLIKLVRGDTPGHKVTMGLVRGGKPENCEVTVGARDSSAGRERPRVFRFRPDERLQRMFEVRKVPIMREFSRRDVQITHALGFHLERRAGSFNDLGSSKPRSGSSATAMGPMAAAF